MDEIRFVTLTGALEGRYEIREENDDGTVLLGPDTSIEAIRRRLGSTPVSEEEFLRHFGDLPFGPA